MTQTATKQQPERASSRSRERFSLPEMHARRSRAVQAEQLRLFWDVAGSFFEQGIRSSAPPIMRF